MKRRPYLLFLTFSVLASVTLLVVWSERHRQQVRAHEAAISASRNRSTLPQDRSPQPGTDSHARDITELLHALPESPQPVTPPDAPSADPPAESDSREAPQWDDGNTLFWAAASDDLPTVRKMLRTGMGVNRRDKQRRTLLMLAAAHGATRVFHLLLAEGADVNARDVVGWTALMFVAQTDNVTIAHELLQHGAHRRLRDHENHWTAEERAVRAGQERMAELLRTGHIRPRSEAESQWCLAHDERAATSPRTNAQVDAHCWIKSVLLSGDSLESSDRECGVVVVDADGKRGEPFEGDYYNLPQVQVFHDTDGRPYAFIQGNQRMAKNYIVAIQGRTLVQKCDCSAYYDAFCQPLHGGGALVIAFEATYDKMEGKPIEGIPVPHQNDDMATVSRFRHGKLTDLSTIYLPSQ